MQKLEKFLNPVGTSERQVNEKALGGAIMKKAIVVISVVIVMAMFAGCASGIAQADVTPTPDSQVEQIVLVEDDIVTPAPEPEIVLIDLPDDIVIPDFYSEVVVPGVTERVFAFTDSTGNTQLRVYGEMTVLVVQEATAEAQDEVISEDETIAGFFPVVVIQTGEDEMDEPLYSIEFVDDALNPVLDEEEAAGVGTPVEPDSDTLIPEEFKPVDGTAGLFTYSPTEDEVYYFTYCVFTNGEGKFYPADENGVVVPGVLPVTLDAEGNILVILNVDGEIIYTSVVDSGLAEDPAVEDGTIIDDEAVIDSGSATKDDEKSGSKQDSKPAATQKPESKPDSGSVSGSDPEPEDNDSQQGDTSTPSQPESTPEPEPTEKVTVYDPYADCTLVARTVCNTCGADITHRIAEHGPTHMDIGENFSYREQMGWKFPDGHIEWIN